MIPVLTTLGGLIREIDLGAAAKALQESREANISAYLKAANVGVLILNVFFIALVPAVCEELFFRGIIQKFAYSFLQKPGLAILLSGIVFALMHFTVYEFVPILLAGLLLAWVYQVTGSIWLNILLHFLNNGLQVLIAYYAVRAPGLKNLDNNTAFAIGIALAGLLLLLWGLRRLYLLRTPLPPDWNVEEGQQETENNSF
jgi:membrane protease YdiL (CAAX protease family)